MADSTMRLISLPTKETLLSSAEWHEEKAEWKAKSFPDEAARHARIAKELRQKARAKTDG